MSEQRSITLAIHSVRQMDIATEVTHEKLWGAIGYLSSWNMTFPSVTIFADRDLDLVAVYSREDGTRGYTIGAVWDGDHDRYGYHS